MRAPPRFPRVLYVAAFAVASFAQMTPRRAKPIGVNPGLIRKRDADIAKVVQRYGRSVIAAGRAGERFDELGPAALRPLPPKPLPPPIDPIVALLIDCAEIRDAIGQPSAAETRDAAWFEIDRSVRITIRLFWRGDLINGEKLVRRLSKNDAGDVIIIDGGGETTGYSRKLDMDRMRSAAEAVTKTLRAAGHRVAPFCETKRIKTPNFNGAMATFVVFRAAERVVAASL